MKRTSFAAIWLLALVAAAVGASGCTTEAYCWDDCAGSGGGGAGGAGATDAGGSDGGFVPDAPDADACFGFNCPETGTDGGACFPTNGGVEQCDSVDNDCDTLVDECGGGIDCHHITTCGGCGNNCYVKLSNVKAETITCTWSGNEGEPGACDWSQCADDFWSLDGPPPYGDKQNGCEYFCILHPANKAIADAHAPCASDVDCADVGGGCVNQRCTGKDESPETCNKDDDCDGVKDDDVDLCNDVNNCGVCGYKCVAANASVKCVPSAPPPCDSNTAKCAIDQCAPGFVDLDGSYANGCEYECSPNDGGAGLGIEACGNSIDDDCDGKIDEADDLSGDPNIGVVCYGDPDGECAEPSHAGTIQCIGNQYACAGNPCDAGNPCQYGTCVNGRCNNLLKENDKLEVCDLKDNDCDGAVDDSPTDAGGLCGKNQGNCSQGTMQCQSGQLKCVGAVDPLPEVCNGQDDDCDGCIDATGSPPNCGAGTPPPDATGACDVPPPPPPGATTPCKAGAKQCVGGTVQCVGSVKASNPPPADKCGDDTNCDGSLDGQPDLSSDVSHCGSCNNACGDPTKHQIWACENGACVYKGCESGYWDVNKNPADGCEYACTFVQAQEACNAVDDNCDGITDNVTVTPSPTQVCGVSTGASAPECTTQVTVACQGGQWKCTFPNASVCNPTCAAATEICDAYDNNCNGALNENVPNFGKPCASDDGLPAPGHGACKTTGSYVCDTTTTTKCSALKADCNTLPGGCAELCDGVDNDCDGSIDEPKSTPGSNASHYHKPVVTKIGSALWISTYEASRPNATSQSPGTGNGYWTSAPSGETLDKTPACSKPGVVPWFNVSPQEVKQVCQAAGGFICNTSHWQTACQIAPTNCTWGYAPRTHLSGGPGPDCTEPYIAASKYCNLAPFDFSAGTPGDQDGLLPTASSLLKNCWSDWASLQGNTATTNRLFDLTGNLREITQKDGSSTEFRLMGGAFNTQDEQGATCTFTFYTVLETFKLYDVGFRCCFSTDPSL